MLLRSITIQGFKSFADKTELKFGKGITAVVGPNGSGKSNISDAVRWVLGEQSTKNLRGQSMEDVIFGGTALRRPHGYCEVTLNIDNSDRSLNFDNDNVSITRRYYRSHESEYMINNVSVRLKDINELFMDTGLGRDGYSMIGQGKIDNIISSKSQERRDIFEEASGISKYRYRKIEAERKLVAAEDNLLRLHDIMKELRDRVGPLKEQSEKAEKFLDLAEQKKRLEIGLWLYTLNNSKDALKQQENKITAARLKYNEIDEELKSFDLKTEQNSKDFALVTGLIEQKRESIFEHNEEIARIGGEISVIETNITHKNESVETLKSEIEGLLVDGETAKAEIEFKQSVIKEKETVIASLKEKLALLEQELNSMLTDSEKISRQIEDLTKKLNVISTESADLRVTLISANNSKEEIKSRNATIDEILSNKTGEEKELEKELNENNKFLSEIQSKITELNNSLDGYKLILETRKEKKERLFEETQQLNLDIEAKKRRIQILTELEKNYEGFNNSVKEVMSLSSSGVLRGIHGPVSTIINTDKKYSVAIETALGATIQQIVCDTENNAKYAIEHLKKAQKGRATFLPISSIKAREFTEKGFEDMYGYIGVAPELITCENKYKEIVNYLLGNTVVCEDLDSAVAISKKFGYRFKTVSLDGQVVNAGGSLTGGSLIKNSGILSRASDIKRLEDEVSKLDKELKAKQTELDNATQELNKVDADICTYNAEILNLSEDKIRVSAEIKRIVDIKDGITKNINELNDERNNAQEKIKALEISAQESNKKLNELELEKQSIQGEIDSMTGGRDGISAKRESITADITAVKIEIMENEKDIENLNNAAASLSAAADDKLNKISMLNSQIELLSETVLEYQKQIEELKVKSATLAQSNTDYETEIEDFIKKRSEIEHSGVVLRNSEKERTGEREIISGELARLNERREIMLKEYDNVINQLYDEYQLTRTQAEEMDIVIDKPAAAKKELSEVKAKIRSLGNVNVSAIEEYKEVFERYTFLNEQINDVETSRAELNKLINQLTSQMKELFVVGFNKINENFGVTFTELFGGGSAKLVLSDPDNILESGIDIDVKLPGKTVPNIDGLSGGEKALIALSIYFSIMRVNAPPFCFLDEVDTALDELNVDRVADYMRRDDFSTQFICVTHRRGTMEAADMIYGVTMQEKGITKLLELNVSELEKQLLEN